MQKEGRKIYEPLKTKEVAFKIKGVTNPIEQPFSSFLTKSSLCTVSSEPHSSICSISHRFSKLLSFLVQYWLSAVKCRTKSKTVKLAGTCCHLWQLFSIPGHVFKAWTSTYCLLPCFYLAIKSKFQHEKKNVHHRCSLSYFTSFFCIHKEKLSYLDSFTFVNKKLIHK